MNVGRSQLHGFLDHHVDQSHDRGAVLVHDIARYGVRILSFRKVDGRIGEFLQHRVSAFAFHLTVIAVDGLQDRLARSQGGFYLAVENEPQLFDGLNVKRIADGHLQGVVLLGQRQGRVFARPIRAPARSLPRES